MLIPILGLIAILGSAIALLIVSILKLTYLYQMAKFFREYQPEPEQAEITAHPPVS